MIDFIIICKNYIDTNKEFKFIKLLLIFVLFLSL